MRLPTIYKLLPVLVIVALAGCNETESKNKSQVAAKVNDDEITVHQLNLAIGAMGEKALKLDKESLRTAVLNNMIMQTLMEQEAEKAKLDREPYVMQAVEAAKRKVLASAYMQQIATITPSVSEADIESYYATNTDLFANRKLFVYKQLTLESDIDNYDSVLLKVKQTESLDTLTSWLKQKSIPYKVITEARTSENIPKNLLKPLTTLDIGQVGFLNLKDGLLAIEVKDKQPQAIDLEMATPAIRQLLEKQQQQMQIEQKVNALKSAAQIEYSDEMKPDSTTLTMDKTPSIDTEIDQESFIEKGLKGLD